MHFIVHLQIVVSFSLPFLCWSNVFSHSCSLSISVSLVTYIGWIILIVIDRRVEAFDGSAGWKEAKLNRRSKRATESDKLHAFSSCTGRKSINQR